MMAASSESFNLVDHFVDRHVREGRGRKIAILRLLPDRKPGADPHRALSTVCRSGSGSPRRVEQSIHYNHVDLACSALDGDGYGIP